MHGQHEAVQTSESTNYRFSFILIVRNGEKHLSESLESLKKQTYRNYEVVVVDDFSTDDSQNIVMENLEPNWTFIRVLENIGRAKARNLAAFYSKGKFLVIQDADDKSVDERLNYLEEILKTNNDELDIVVGKIRYIYDSGKLGNSERIPIDDNECKSLLAKGKMPFAHSASCIRRQLLFEVGGYPLYERAQDLALFIKLRDSKYVFDSRIHAFYRRKLIIPYGTFKASHLNVRRIRQDLLGITTAKYPMPVLWILSEIRRLFRLIRFRSC